MTIIRISSLLLCLFCTHALAAINLIQSISVEKNKISVIADPTFHARYLKSNFFVEYDTNIDLTALDFSLVTIPFVMNVIPIIWISEETYTIDAMDEDLYNSLATIQKIFQAFYPSKKWSGKLIPKKLIKHTVTKKNNYVATLFSGGLDATQTALHNRDKKQLLVTICGGDIGLNKATMWHNVQQQCTAFGRYHNCTNTFIRSNFNIFRNFQYLRTLTPELHGNWFAWTSQSLGYTSLVAPLAYLEGCSQILMASTRTHENPFPYGTHPVIDNAIFMAGISVHHDSPHLNRVEKIRDIVAICSHNNLKKPCLRVCWGHDPNGGNCNTCEKCFRTIVELLVEAQNPQDYGFNISLSQAIATARAQAPGKETLDAGLMWHWQCIQTAAKNNLAQHKSLFDNQELAEFISWIAALDLSKYKRSTTKQRSSKEKKAFEQLWHKSVNRTFTTDDLVLLQKNRRVSQ